MTIRTFLSALLLGLLAACGGGSEQKQKAEPSAPPAPVIVSDDARDTHSYARPQEARVTHVSLDLTADFEKKQVHGTATLAVQAAKDAKAIILDTRQLAIEKVTDGEGRQLPYQLGKTDPILGTPLTVQLLGAGKIVIHYASAPDAPALQWLSPEQTAGKKHPYLFSQGQAILNRSWIPTQDSPGIRQSWDASITVPEELKAVMSAEMLTPDGEASDGGRVFRFREEQPVAPYLIAIAIGDLAFKEIGPRTGVWAEPAQLEKSASEFADLEKMVAAAEQLYGPYRWGRYDLLILPPSFPFGGMENPHLTFVTPTILAGDRSLVTLVAHELAHSWSGNLVTNATWNDFWLNEGFTVYFENRIMEALYGPERAAMLADLGWSDMQAAIKDAGGPNAPDTRLHLDLRGRDPDDGMTDIAYEKGAVFLRTIEKAVGRARWDAYLKDYFNRNAFKPQTSAGFLADLRAHLINGDTGLEKALGLDAWVYQPGLPKNAVHMTSPAFAQVDAAAKAYAAGGSVDSIPVKTWVTQHYQRFLTMLPRTLPAERLATLDKAWGLSNNGNSEIRFAWLMLALPNRYQPAAESAEAFLMAMGRRKFVAPLFETLNADAEWGAPLARRIYARARPGYHSVTTGTVDKTLHWSQ